MDGLGFRNSLKHQTNIRKALTFCFLGKAVGVVIDTRSVAYEQGIVLGKLAIVATLNKLYRQPQLRPGLDKGIQGTAVGGRQRVVRVVQDGDVVARRRASLQRAPALLAIERYGTGKGIALRRCQPV